MLDTVEKNLVPVDENTYNLILAMKKARIEKKMTLQSIVDKCEEAGYAISLTTVKRVFVEESEYKRFNYNSTLRPIARAMGNLDEEVPVAAKENTPAVNDLLRAVIDIKEDTISEMKRGIQTRDDELIRVRDEYSLRLQEKNDEITQLKRVSKIQTIAIVVLAVTLVVFLAVMR